MWIFSAGFLWFLSLCFLMRLAFSLSFCYGIPVVLLLNSCGFCWGFLLVLYGVFSRLLLRACYGFCCDLLTFLLGWFLSGFLEVFAAGFLRVLSCDFCGFRLGLILIFFFGFLTGFDVDVLRFLLIGVSHFLQFLSWVSCVFGVGFLVCNILFSLVIHVDSCFRIYILIFTYSTV